MAAGDTIPGVVAVEKEDASGDRTFELGPYSHSLLDNSGDVANQMYVNAAKAFNTPPPQAGNRVRAAGLVFHPGEVIRARHKSASLSEAIDYDADEIEISIVDQDLNTGKLSPQTLTVSDTELSANPTSSTTDFVTFFEETVPDMHRYFVAGPVNLAAVENA